MGGGIIPAYAGNTQDSMLSAPSMRDHPRVCGEHPEMAEIARSLQGSSPRMRGTLADHAVEAFACGIIPAYAGNTVIDERLAPDVRDHPRVCGEHGTIPRPAVCWTGSSPRMRGTPVVGTWVGGIKGIIPAYAGNTL